MLPPEKRRIIWVLTSIENKSGCERVKDPNCNKGGTLQFPDREPGKGQENAINP